MHISICEKQMMMKRSTFQVKDEANKYIREKEREKERNEIIFSFVCEWTKEPMRPKPLVQFYTTEIIVSHHKTL